MKMQYSSAEGQGPAYEIETDRQGSYTIRQQGKVVRRVTALTAYLGKPRWGSKKLELGAVAEAKAAIDRLQAPSNPARLP